MKIMILNSSGNVGKTTITSLFAERLASTKIIEVETVNKGNSEVKGLDVYKHNAKDDFSVAYEQLVMNENVIVDIGASNLGNFVDKMQEYSGIESFFDVFVIPSTPDEKIQTDTFKTVNFLRELGVEDDKIKVVFNRIKTNLESDYAMLLNAPFPFNKTIAIRETALFKELGFLRMTSTEVFNEDINYYLQFMLKAKEPQDKAKNLKLDLTNKMLHKFKDDFDYVFSEVTNLKPEISASKKKVGEEPTKTKTKENIEEVTEDVTEEEF